MGDEDVAARVQAGVNDLDAAADVEPDWVRHREPSKSPTAVYSVRRE